MLFALGFYDIVTFAVLIFILAGFMTVFLLLLGLPGRIARKRNHPDADAVNLLGWVGMLGILPWIHALIWSIKETDVIDIRRFPEEERQALREQAERFAAESKKKKSESQNKDRPGTADQPGDGEPG